MMDRICLQLIWRLFVFQSNVWNSSWICWWCWWRSGLDLSKSVSMCWLQSSGAQAKQRSGWPVCQFSGALSKELRNWRPEGGDPHCDHQRILWATSKRKDCAIIITDFPEIVSGLINAITSSNKHWFFNFYGIRMDCKHCLRKQAVVFA